MKQSRHIDFHTSDIFDSPGYVQKVDFKNGRATYSATKLKPPWKPITSFGGPIVPLHNSMLYNAVNTNVLEFDGKYIALYDSGTPYVVGKKGNVKPLSDTHDILRGSINAHPKVLEDGTIVFLKLTHSYDIFSNGLQTTLEFITISKHGGKVLRHDRIAYPRFLYVHDFMVTESYYIVYDHNTDVDISFWRLDGVAKRLRAGDKQHMFLIDRHTLEIHKIALPPSMDGKFASHHVHACEDKNKLRVASVMYSGYMQGPMNIYAFDICRSDESKSWEVRDVHSLSGTCEFPVDMVLATGRTTALSCLSHIGVFQWSKFERTPSVVEVYREPYTLFTEAAWDPRSKHAMCYIYRDGRIWLQIYSVMNADTPWHMCCELGFHGMSTPPMPGLHGTFYGSIV